MANFKLLNQMIQNRFPQVQVEAVRGNGYVYFSASNAVSWPESLMVHPVNTHTLDLFTLCCEQIEEWLPGHLEWEERVKKMASSSEKPKEVKTPVEATEAWAAGDSAKVDGREAEIVKWLEENAKVSSEQLKVWLAISLANENGRRANTLTDVAVPYQKEQTFSYSKTEHEAIQAIKEAHLRLIAERGRFSQTFTRHGIDCTNYSFVSVKHLDELCGLPTYFPINPNKES